MRSAFTTLLLSFLLLTSCQYQPVIPATTPRFVPSDQPPVKVDTNKTPYTFGYLEVPENRQRADSRMIRLPVYVFKSRSAAPAPDPVLFTVGGPGQTSLGAAPYMQYYQYLNDRDLILFEQRGTTYAQPNLACPEWTEVATRVGGQSLSTADLDAEYVRAAARCRERLLTEGVDLDGYNTREIAADIEDLRMALKLEKLNLLTISYSTKIAQTMMREYPGSLRSVVMDGALPLAANWDESSLTNLMETYDDIFADCAANPDCAAKHPDLSARFRQFLQEVSANPIVLEVARPQGKGNTTVEISGADIAGYLGELGTGDFPRFLAQLEAILQGDRQPLRDNFSWPEAGPGNGLGMRLSVWCSEELSFVDPAKVRAERERYPFLAGASPLIFSFEVCRTWKVRPAPARENQPIRSEVPTLLISGSYDPVTPVKWANQLDRELANSHHVIFPGWTHTPTTYWDNPCGMRVANTFFNDPTRAPTLPCYTALTVPDFE